MEIHTSQHRWRRGASTPLPRAGSPHFTGKYTAYRSVSRRGKACPYPSFHHPGLCPLRDQPCASHPNERLGCLDAHWTRVSIPPVALAMPRRRMVLGFSTTGVYSCAPHRRLTERVGGGPESWGRLVALMLWRDPSGGTRVPLRAGHSGRELSGEVLMTWDSRMAIHPRTRRLDHGYLKCIYRVGCA